MPALPPVIHGVRILAGTEIDIVDLDGRLAGYDATTHIPGLSYADALLNTRDIVIASVHHFEGFRDGSVLDNTRMYCNIASNPKIDIIGHPARSGLRFEADQVLTAAKASGCMIEVNEHSFDSGEDVISAIRTLAIRCAELGVYIAVGSDAHSSFFVGGFTRALALLEDIGFPEELVANASLERLLGIRARKRS
jgi:putative hydrolase